MASNKARIASCPGHKWPASLVALPRLPPKSWVPFANLNDDLTVDFLAQGFDNLSISSMDPGNSMTSTGISTIVSPTASEGVHEVFHCLPMDITDPPNASEPVQSNSESKVMFRGDGTMDSPFTEVASSEKPCQLDVKACTKQLKKVAKSYGFKIIKVIWVISPPPSLEPHIRGPNIV